MKNIVLSHKVERDNLLKDTYVLRKGLDAAQESIKNTLIKVIIGPRRAGKSVFAIEMLRGFNFAYLNFDDERLVGVSDYDDLIKAIRQVYGDTKYILFDEIQNVRNWELFVNRLNRSGFNIVITGSNSRHYTVNFSLRYSPTRIAAGYKTSSSVFICMISFFAIKANSILFSLVDTSASFINASTIA